jgi:ferredoxin
VGGKRVRRRVHAPPDDTRAPIQANCTRVSSICSLSGVTYVITGSCIKDDSCVEVCPVDCIHPKPGAADFETAEQLYIDPEVCIDCDACVEACPVDAIFAEFEVPEKHAYALEVNAQFFVEASTSERTAA